MDIKEYSEDWNNNTATFSFLDGRNVTITLGEVDYLCEIEALKSAVDFRNYKLSEEGLSFLLSERRYFKIDDVYDTERDYYTLVADKINVNESSNFKFLGVYELKFIEEEEIGLDSNKDKEFIEQRSNEEVVFLELPKALIPSINVKDLYTKSYIVQIDKLKND